MGGHRSVSRPPPPLLQPPLLFTEHNPPCSAAHICRYAQDGFIHLTADPALLLTVANHFYQGSAGDWLVLVLRADDLSAEARDGSVWAQACTCRRGRRAGPLLWRLLGRRALLSCTVVPQVKLEPAAPVGSKTSEGLLGGAQSTEGQPSERREPLFPHLYGTIDFAAVEREVPMQRDAGGAFLGIPGLL